MNSITLQPMQIVTSNVSMVCIPSYSSGLWLSIDIISVILALLMIWEWLKIKVFTCIEYDE